MGVLTSKLFTTAEPSVVKRLEDCATGQPNEAQSHFTLGQTGEHIKKTQEALQSVKETNPALGIPDFSVNGVYDQKFADAIRVYKTKRDIRNFANKIDDVVGVNTIRRLDKDNKSGPPKVNPGAPPAPKKPGDVPRPLPNCVPDASCPPASEFDITLLGGLSGGEVAELGKFFFTIRDTTNGLSTIYLLRTVGIGAGALPISVAGGGGTKHFTTSKPVRVTRFGPFGNLASASNKTQFPLSISLLVLAFRPDDLRAPRVTAPMTIDTGPLEIPSASAHGGQLKILTRCGGGAGATRRILTLDDARE